MFERHITKEGKELFISQMSDSHLESTIMMYINKIREAKNNLIAEDIRVSPMQTILYGVDPKALQKRARHTIRAVSTKLYPYLAEACLRGMDFSKELQDVYERDGTEHTQFILPAEHHQITYEVEEDHFFDEEEY
jgi:hypothetical protein